MGWGHKLDMKWVPYLLAASIHQENTGLHWHLFPSNNSPLDRPYIAVFLRFFLQWNAPHYATIPPIWNIVRLYSFREFRLISESFAETQKGLGTSTTSTTTGSEDQRQHGCSVLPVGVVSEYIACCALCGWNFFFASQRTACLIIKALSIAWYNFDNVSLQLSTQYNYVFKKQSYSSC